MVEAIKDLVEVSTAYVRDPLAGGRGERVVVEAPRGATFQDVFLAAFPDKVGVKVGAIAGQIKTLECSDIAPLQEEILFFPVLEGGQEILFLLVGGPIAVSTLITKAANDEISALLYPPPPTEGNGAASESSNYGFGEKKNVTSPGAVIPIVYGQVRAAPPRPLAFISGREFSVGHVPTRIGTHGRDGDNVQFINLLYVLCSHELDSIKSPRLNNTAIEEFPGVTTETRMGALDQTAIPYFDTIRVDEILNFPMDLESTAWTTKTLSATNTRGLVVGLSWPQGLTRLTSKGHRRYTEVKVKIQYKLTASGTWLDFGPGNRTEPPGVYYFDGNVIAPVRVAVRLDDIPEGQYDIRVGFNEAPGANATSHIRTTVWEYAQSLTYDEFSRPGVSLLAIKGVASQELNSSVGEMTVLMERVNVSVWDGSNFITKPANNPAWASWDILFSDDGLKVDKDDIIYSDFLVWADFCTAANLKVNVYLDKSRRASDNLDIIGACGKGKAVPVGSKFGAIFDAPATATNVFGMGNIVSGSYSLERSERRVAKLKVVYYPKKNNFEREEFSVTSSDFELIDVDGEETVELIGCTDFDAALNIGQTALNRAVLTTDLLKFSTGLDGMQLQPNDVIAFKHDAEIEFGYSGRILSATSTSVVLDENVEIGPTGPYKILSRKSDGTLEDQQVVNAGGLVNATYRWPLSGSGTLNYYCELAAGGDPSLLKPNEVFEDGVAMVEGVVGLLGVSEWGYGDVDGLGFDTIYVHLSDGGDPDSRGLDFVGIKVTTDTLDLVGPWASIPSEYDVYCFGEVATYLREYRVVSKSRDGDLDFNIEAVNYDQNVYVPGTLNFELDKNIQNSEITGLVGSGRFEQSTDGTSFFSGWVTWRGTALTYYVWARKPGGDWKRLGSTDRQEFLVDNPTGAGQLEVSVSVVDGPDSINYTQLDFSFISIPEDITNFTAKQVRGDIHLTWDPVSGRDFSHYEIRWGSVNGGFQAGISLGETTTNSFIFTPALDGAANRWFFSIAAIDRSGERSENAPIVSITVDLAAYQSAVVEYDESVLDYPGTAVNMVADTSLNWLFFSPSLEDDGPINSSKLDTQMTHFEGATRAGSYTSSTKDLGSVMDFHAGMYLDLAAVSLDRNNGYNFLDRVDTDVRGDTDTNLRFEINASMSFRVHDTNISLATWSPYAGGVIGARGRYFQFRYEIALGQDNIQSTVLYMRIRKYSPTNP